MNVFLELEGKPKLYCQPTKVGISGDQYVSFLRNYINSTSNAKEMPLSIFRYLLVKPMVEVFPCR